MRVLTLLGQDERGFTADGRKADGADGLYDDISMPAVNKVCVED